MKKADYDIVFTQREHFACLLSVVNKHNLYVDIDRQLLIHDVHHTVIENILFVSV